MTVQEPAWQAAEAAIEALAPEASEFGSLDMAGFGESIFAVLARAAGHPGDTAARSPASAGASSGLIGRTTTASPFLSSPSNSHSGGYPAGSAASCPALSAVAIVISSGI